MTDLEILENLSIDAKASEKALAYLYSSKIYKEPIIRFFQSKSLSIHDCQALWTDTVIKFSSLVKAGKYQHQGKLIGYLKNLAGYLFLNHIRDNKKYKTDELSTLVIKDPYVEATTRDHKELKLLIGEQLSVLKDMCKSILYLWAQNYSMEEIKLELNIVSEEATRKRKHICLKELLDKVHGNERLMNILKDYYYDQE